MRDAIVLSTWNWETFNVPERIALALGSRGARVLYCDLPVSRFRKQPSPANEISTGIRRFTARYLGGKLNAFPIARGLQWKSVARQTLVQAHESGLSNPIFFYSHVKYLAPLCNEMRTNGLPLFHICMDYPEGYQYELIALSDRTLVIPPTVFQKLRAKYGEKIERIPQSIHFPADSPHAHGANSEPAELARIPHPRLGYLGPVHARVNLRLVREAASKNPDWHFIFFGNISRLSLPNVHGIPWREPRALFSIVSALDAGIMPYDCFEEKNLHCAPLKLFDYFAAGLPVVSTPVISLWKYSDLIYFGETAGQFSGAVREALSESSASEKRKLRLQVARAHSTEALGRRLEEIVNAA